ncbi:DUF4192 domain-containing protein [Pseudonocardia kujensis]|uniref:DUF4192 domain-containing protein n=1 Tax=Pseudonocardia kujensis TaxID=1128675 RepID=UPI001E631E08|nr:DUF4192 domain-containing protein [Pseudonocardia kujensis]MCE0767534.1 DUF4192 domain-containing protein [Pseudonocardia kujensis]
MTPAPSPVPPPVPPSALSALAGLSGLPGDPDSPVRVGTEGLLVAVPVLIGFRPRDSLVMIATGGPHGRRVGLTLRVDLPPPDDPELVAALCESAAAALCRDDPEGAAVLVVGGGEPGAGRPAAPGEPEWPPRADVAGAATLALLEREIGVHTVAWAAEIAAGAAWRCYPLHDCGCAGTLPDPAASVLAATAVARGAVVRDSREELAKVVEPTDDAAGPAAGSAGPAASSSAAGAGGDSAGTAGSVDPGSPAGQPSAVDPRRLLRDALADAAAGRLVVGRRLARAMASALRRPWFRDEALAACAGPTAPEAEQLWAALARTSPGADAATPAALLAVSALLRGDGALANLALDRALGADPGHRLAHSLRAALDGGWGPREIRAWLEGER